MTHIFLSKRSQVTSQIMLICVFFLQFFHWSFSHLSRLHWNPNHTLIFFFLSLLRYSWQNCKTLNVCNMIIWYMYILWMEKAMAPHSSALAWKIPWTEEPGWLQSMGSLGVGHDWATSLSLFAFMHWRRQWQPTPVFLPGESQGWGSLVGCHLWGHTKSDTTEVT